MPHSRRGSGAGEVARKYVDKCGTGARLRKNRLVFVAADVNKTGLMDDYCRTLLAWRAVRDAIIATSINVTKQEESQVQASLAQSETMLKSLVGECFKQYVQAFRSRG